MVPIFLPPLRERREDIVQLAEHIIAGFCAHFKQANVLLSPEAKKKLQDYKWMGNIRELSNMCERMVVLNQEGMIDEEDVLAVLPQMDGDRTSGTMTHGRELKKTDDEFTEQVRRLEKDRITAVLKEAGNHKIKASEYLGVSRTTLWRRMKELDVH